MLNVKQISFVVFQVLRPDQHFNQQFREDHQPRSSADRLCQDHQTHHPDEGERPCRQTGDRFIKYCAMFLLCLSVCKSKS